jgi:superfamily II DNA or RNA helicase
MRKLRPYQQSAIDATLNQLQQHNSAVVVLPTGLGKTVYASKLIADWDAGNCLFLAHTKELIVQAADKLSVDLGYRPAIEMGMQGQDIDTLFDGGMCVVGSVQSMYGDRRLDKYGSNPFSLIVIDECHHSTASTYRKVVDYFSKLNPNLKVVGITATPNRSDGTALGILFDSVAYQMTINDAVEGGWLVPVKQEYVIVDELNFDGIKSRKNEFGEQDFNASQLEEILTEEETLHKMAVPTIEKVGDRRTLIFTASVAHAHQLAAVLNRYKPGTAAAVDGGTDSITRKRVISDFSNGTLQFLCNCAVLTEGFDAPACNAIVMGRPTKSLSLYTQMLGRGLRPLPGIVDGVEADFDRRMAILTSEKPNCLVLDFVGNSEHKLANSYDVLGGNYDVETRQLARDEARKVRCDVGEVMDAAAKLLALERQWREREELTAKANYGSYEVDPFGGSGPSVNMNTGVKRGGSTEGQIGFLVELGVSREKATTFTKKQAGAVIDEISANKCTRKQLKVLLRAGIKPDGIGVKRASRIIDAMSKNGWRRPEVIPE